MFTAAGGFFRFFIALFLSLASLNLPIRLSAVAEGLAQMNTPRLPGNFRLLLEISMQMDLSFVPSAGL
jgi:hypothetical protein